VKHFKQIKSFNITEIGNKALQNIKVIISIQVNFLICQKADFILR